MQVDVELLEVRLREIHRDLQRVDHCVQDPLLVVAAAGQLLIEATGVHRKLGLLLRWVLVRLARTRRRVVVHIVQLNFSGLLNRRSEVSIDIEDLWGVGSLGLLSLSLGVQGVRRCDRRLGRVAFAQELLIKRIQFHAVELLCVQLEFLDWELVFCAARLKVFLLQFLYFLVERAEIGLELGLLFGYRQQVVGAEGGGLSKMLYGRLKTPRYVEVAQVGLSLLLLAR